MRGFIIILTVCLGVTSAVFDNQPWNNLRVKWDPNLFSSYSLAYMPRTVADAVDNGFTKLSDCNLKAPWRGARYYKDGEYALTLLFDINGYIAGIQSSIPNNQSNGFPQPVLQPPFVQDGDRWVVSVYFTDPSKICTTGRSASQVEAEGTGTDLYIQNSTRPEDSMVIPHNVEDLANTLWTKGKCFLTMGLHYWYNLSDDMSCSSIFPIFLLFNKNKLNALGFAFTTGIESPRYEHPPSYSFKLFMASPPKCLEKEETITTMHIFLNSYPAMNFC